MPIIELFKGDYNKRYNNALNEIIELQNRHNILTNADIIRKAFDFALRIHENQKRKDGKDYIVHPIAVAKTCAEYWMDDVSIAGALLHDTVEDSEKVKLTCKDIENDFGPEIAKIVDGVTKLKSQHDDPSKARIETLKKLLEAAAIDDIRIIIIKIFDRHDNVKSIEVFKKFRDGIERQNKIAYETQRFYIPIAARLGLYKVAREMEDHLMRALDNSTYLFIQKWLRQKESKIKPQIDNIIKQLKIHHEMRGVELTEKFYHRGIYQIFEQLKEQKVGLESLDKAIAYNLTLIVPTEEDCYLTLGIVHKLYPHLRDSVFDFISNPKINGYQSLHTVIVLPDSSRLQVLIRTPDMDQRNHLGLIAQLRQQGRAKNDQILSWIQQLVSSFDVIGQKDFLDVTSKVLFKEVEVLTPKGERKLLPEGSTALDYAFSIHSEVGIHARYAEIEGRERKLNTILKRGQLVNIITDPVPQAKPHWFGWVTNPTSKLALKKYFKKEQKKQIEMEEERFISFCREKLDIKIDRRSSIIEELRTQMGYGSREDFFRELYTGRLPYEFVIPQLVMNIGLKECKKLCKMMEEKGLIAPENAQKFIKECSENEFKENLKNTIAKDLTSKLIFSEYVEIPGLKYPLPINFARCCNPMAPFPIIAITSKEKGAVIHRSDCNCIYGLKEFSSVNIVEAKWKKNPEIRKMLVRFRGTDRPNLLHDLTHLLKDVKSNILEMSVKVKEGNIFTGEVLFELPDIINQEFLKERLLSIKSIHIIDIQIVQ